MIELPIEVGILGWVSTLTFALALGLIAYGVFHAIFKYNKRKNPPK